MKNKIGVAVITCNREYFFRDCVRSIGGVDTLIVVNDGVPYPDDAYPSSVKEVIQHEVNTNVATAKNDAFRYLIEDGCEHLFMVEDDVEIINEEVYREYIRAAEVTGLWHLMFGFHGLGNKDELGNKEPRFVVKYENNVSIALCRACCAAFTYHHKDIIEKIGFMNEGFDNWLENAEHSYRLVELGMLPGLRWWPDIENSDSYIWDLDHTLEHSVIRKSPEELEERSDKADKFFETLYGQRYTNLKEFPLGEVLDRMKEIQKKYAHKVFE